jgi:hypothetical protein
MLSAYHFFNSFKAPELKEGDCFKNGSVLLLKSVNRFKTKHEKCLFSEKSFPTAFLASLNNINQNAFYDSVPDSIEIKKASLQKGVCNGMSWWMTLLYLQGEKSLPSLSLDKRALMIAQIFREGAPKRASFLQFLHKIEPFLEYNQSDMALPPDGWKTTGFQLHTLSKQDFELAKDRCYHADFNFAHSFFKVCFPINYMFKLNDLSTYPDLNLYEPNIFLLTLPRHRAVLIKTEKAYLLFDPNTGLVKLNSEKLAETLKDFCQIYINKDNCFASLTMVKPLNKIFGNFNFSFKSLSNS